VSPILVRPVREQLEHDRLIRFLQTKYKRKFEVATNVGDEQAAPVKIGAGTFYPDLVLTAAKRLAGVVEVESSESVNNLEALAQWVHFSRARVPFHLYVPVPVFDAARRLCQANNASVSEIWTYRPSMDGFDLVRMYHGPVVAPRPVKHPPSARPAPARPAPAVAKAKPPAPKPARTAARKPAKAAAPKVGARTAARARPKPGKR
jgi:hypothetical protein